MTNRPVWLIFAGELMQLLGVVAVAVGLALGFSHWRFDIPTAAGLLAFYAGRRLRKAP